MTSQFTNKSNFIILWWTYSVRIGVMCLASCTLSKQSPCLNISNSENVHEADYFLKHATLRKGSFDELIRPFIWENGYPHMLQWQKGRPRHDQSIATTCNELPFLLHETFASKMGTRSAMTRIQQIPSKWLWRIVTVIIRWSLSAISVQLKGVKLTIEHKLFVIIQWLTLINCRK